MAKSFCSSLRWNPSGTTGPKIRALSSSRSRCSPIWPLPNDSTIRGWSARRSISEAGSRQIPARRCVCRTRREGGLAAANRTSGHGTGSRQCDSRGFPWPNDGRGRPRGETDRAGIYEAWPKTTKGETDLRRWAFNVDPDEGDLTPIGSADLLTRLDPVKVNYHLADQYHQDEVATSGYNLSTRRFCAASSCCSSASRFAYSASYHVVPGAVR